MKLPQTFGIAALALCAAPAVSAATATTVSPHTLFDLSHFKLTLPVNSLGGTGGTAHTIRNRQLNSNAGYFSDYFYTDSNGAMVFRAPSNGASTSPGSGSDHTRSELREEYNIGGKTEWTSRVGGTLSARVRVNKVAVNSDEAVIAQIHGLNEMMLLLAYNPITQNVELKRYETPYSKRPTLHVLARNLRMGAALRYRIQWIGDSLSVTVNQRVSNFTVSPSWSDVPVYFKAGAYHAASNIGNPVGDATQVSFYELSVQH